jgi:hypothetical protein
MKSRLRHHYRFAVWVLAAGLVGMQSAHGQRYAVADIMYVPVPVYGYAYPTPLASHCYPYCAVAIRNRTLERRQQRFEALRAEAPASTEAFGPIRVTKPAMPRGSDEELLPAYRSAGKVRPEYDGSGKYTGPYAELEVSTAPPAEANPAPPSAAEVAAPPAKRRSQPMLPCPKAAREC